MRTHDPWAGGSRQHTCSATEFAPFSDEAIEQSLCARFAEQLGAHRSCLAVSDAKLALTYGELDGWANGIARAVIGSVGGSPRPVPLVLAQGATSVAAILGTLKSGNPYVSLDPRDPRSARIVEQLGATIVLTDEVHLAAARAVAGDRPVLVVDRIEPAGDPGIETSPDALAYVFFTSGSTGRPKGVCDTHRNVLHNVLRYTNTLEIGPRDRLSLVQSPSFSGTVSSLFSALLNGAAVFPLAVDGVGVGSLGRWVRDERITVYHSVPALFRTLPRGDVQSFPDVRVVRLEGDRAAWLDVELHRRHFGPGSILVNGLGLTETGLVRQLFVDRQLPVGRGLLPVGYSVKDMDVLVVGEGGEPVPPGAPGEIAVRSSYLAQGYWNEPELTDERFLGAGAHRTYLTGDLGRILADGCLEYLGRRDGGLKILGNRVEPAEVEAELVRVPGVKEAAVVTCDGRRGEGRLVAFVVADADHVLRASDVRAALGRRLPSYMVPSQVSAVNELPLGANGKVDRRRLPDPPDRAGARSPTDDLERLVVRIWEDVLEVQPVDVDDDFFALGGDSLAAAEIMAYLEHETGTSLPVSVLLGSPTVAGLSDALRSGPVATQAGLVVLRADGDRAPLALVPGVTGNVLHFEGLVPLLDRDRPVWGLEPVEADAVGVVGIAAHHARSLLAMNPSGPFLLMGFCSGAVVAHEVARQLRVAGHEVSLLALLGFTPLDFPSLLPSDVHARWQQRNAATSRFLPRTGYHLRAAWAMPTRARPRYLVTRAANLRHRAWSRIRRRGSADSRFREGFQRALSAHDPGVYPATALVILHADETVLYTDDPSRVWAALAEKLDVAVLPGAGHAMLERPGVARLASLLDERLSAIP